MSSEIDSVLDVVSDLDEKLTEWIDMASWFGLDSPSEVAALIDKLQD